MTLAGPDFICVGMTKAATGWMYDQLQHHPDFWMPPIKEFHYLDGDFPRDKLDDYLDREQRLSAKRLQGWFERTNRRPWSDRDKAFFADAQACKGLPVDFDRYKNLFRHKGEQKSGDITPAYCALPEDMIAAAGKNLPGVKYILLARDPVSWTWSSVNWRHRRIEKKRGREIPKLDTVERVMEAIERSQTSSFGFPSRIYKRWQSRVPPGAVRHFLFDDIASAPDATRDAIIAHLGGNPEKKSGELEADYNRKETRGGEREPLPDDIRAALAGYFRDELHACADLFGGAAEGWPAKYGV